MQPVRFPRYLHQRQATKPQEPAKPAVTWVAIATVFISSLALLGTLFYWTQKNAGRAYREAYLEMFGFRSDALPWNTDDLALLGYVAQADVIVKMLFAFSALSLFAVVMLLAANWASQYFSKHRARKDVKAEQKKEDNIVTSEVVACWAIVVALVVLGYSVVVPLVLFQQARTEGFHDAEQQMGAVRTLNLPALKKYRLNFVEITREKAEAVSGAAISCTEKFCALYSPDGPIHARIVPLSDVKMWSKLEWEDVLARRQAQASENSKTGAEGAVRPSTQPTAGLQCEQDWAGGARRVSSHAHGQRGSRG
ncbi:hypothetical protein [Paraburkholderia silvatlantica]|uniref:Uncharacterized protein n=1 Tax=Paraburkholderia silvatlantica TaxID=321895 RepID=A0ABR6FI54_9BURK|nr:hypothetical protein [Paraburkholderia silvatlantica]MBB2927110.1 hypothetical protein [Paraburkholderia silvatlantica]PVY36831.1 hypothetical protein C7411_102121 [Paraburkholderia silvatlantica]PXW41891.1 hypothetical protein C7413_102300 [Paraburkholderia silvatlantica]